MIELDKYYCEILTQSSRVAVQPPLLLLLLLLQLLLLPLQRPVFYSHRVTILGKYKQLYLDYLLLLSYVDVVVCSVIQYVKS